MRTDPAEHGTLRFFYRGWRPTLFGKLHNRVFAWMAGLGLMPQLLTALQVRSRTTGHLYATVLVPARYNGGIYLVSMLGQASNWVQDVRAASGRAWLKQGRSRPILLTEIPARDRAPVLKAWCQDATSGRLHLGLEPDAPIAEFERIADDYPVFRIEAADTAQA